MSLVTKVFIVLQVVFSIALAAATYSFVARTENWREVAKTARATSLSEQAANKVITAQFRLSESQSAAKIAQLNDEIGRIKRDSADDKARIEQLVSEKAQLENQVTSLVEGSLAGLQQTLNVVQGQLVTEQEFARKLGSRNNELERRNIDLNDRVKEFVVSLAMANQQNRAYLEQISALERRMERVDGNATTMQLPDGRVTVQNVPSAQPTDTPAMALIRGEVKDVKNNLASISVGSADGVTEGMRFMIYRADTASAEPTYVGTLEITRVSANEAAGTLVRRNEDVRIGDSVRNEASFATRG